MFSRFCSNKANAKAGHPAELGSGCSCSPLCGSVGCPALFMYFVPGFVSLLYHAVFHAAFQVRSNIFLHQSDQARAGFLRCPGDVRRDVQAVVVRHFQQRTVTADRLAGKYIERCSGDQAFAQGTAEVTLIHDRAAADVDQNCVPLHVGKRFDIHQVLGRLI